MTQPSMYRPPIHFCPRCGAQIAEGERFGKLRPYCPACGYVHFFDPKVAAAAFVESEGRLLLVLRANDPERGKWALPAGFVDRGEDPAEAVVRETAEETGLIVQITRLVDVLFDGGNIVIVYAAAVTGGTLCAQDDAADVGWFGPDTLPELAFRSTQRLVAAWRARR